MTVLSALLIGYLLGSVLPAVYISSPRGGDIRLRGDGNPGATNVWLVLGPAAGIATASFDIAKGLIAMLIAWQLGVSEPWMYAAGIAAVVGHRFPIWHSFHGGQGMAASVGLLFYCLATLLVGGQLPVAWIVLLALIVVMTFVLYGNSTIIGMVALPLIALPLVLRAPSLAFGAFALTLTGYMWAVQIWLALKNDYFHLAVGPREQLHRLTTRLRS